MRCLWCSNPFGLSKEPQLAVNFDRCIGCGNCVPACPNGVNKVVDGKVAVDFSKCTVYGDCVPVCPVEARKITGKEYTAHELYLEISKDASFYRKNSGGVTLSGGKVLLQHEVAAETLRLCKTNYITTCIETSAFAPWEHLHEVAQYCNFVLVNLKHMDPEKHKELVGVPNKIILENIRKLCEFSACRGTHVIVRTPIIPSYTNDEKNLIATATFLSTLPGRPELNLLPFHNMGEIWAKKIWNDWPHILFRRKKYVKSFRSYHAKSSETLPALCTGNACQYWGRRNRLEDRLTRKFARSVPPQL